LSLINPFVLRASDFKNQNLVRILYLQYFMEEDIGLDYYDLFFLSYEIYKEDTDFFLFNGEKKHILDWIYISLYSLAYFDVLLRSYPTLYSYSNFYQSFQNYCYLVENGVLKLSGKAKQEQKFLDFFANLRN